MILKFSESQNFNPSLSRKHNKHNFGKPHAHRGSNWQSLVRDKSFSFFSRFSKKLIFSTYPGVRNVSFSRYFANALNEWSLVKWMLAIWGFLVHYVFLLNDIKYINTCLCSLFVRMDGWHEWAGIFKYFVATLPFQYLSKPVGTWNSLTTLIEYHKRKLFIGHERDSI